MSLSLCVWNVEKSCAPSRTVAQEFSSVDWSRKQGGWHGGETSSKTGFGIPILT